MDELDRRIVNQLQGGFPLCERPYAEAAARLGIDEAILIQRIALLLEARTLSRFGPLFDAERLGGAFTLCAMSVPRGDFARVSTIVNAHPEVAHNYERDHRLNMWFVLAAISPSAIEKVIHGIEAATGYPVLNFPREEEFCLEMKLTA